LDDAPSRGPLTGSRPVDGQGPTTTTAARTWAETSGHTSSGNAAGAVAPAHRIARVFSGAVGTCCTLWPRDGTATRDTGAHSFPGDAGLRRTGGRWWPPRVSQFLMQNHRPPARAARRAFNCLPILQDGISRPYPSMTPRADRNAAFLAVHPSSSCHGGRSGQRPSGRTASHAPPSNGLEWNTPARVSGIAPAMVPGIVG
jgi:hypothetical protein